LSVELRTYSEPDRQLTLALETDPGVVGHLGGVRDPGDASRTHERRLAAVAGGDLFCTIVPDRGAGPAGIIAIWRSEFESRPIHELGAMLLPRYQAQGLAGQAFDLLVPRAQAHGVTELHAFPAVTNAPSNAILRKLRFRRLEDCDLDYEGRPLRCAHWIRDLSAAPPSDPA
jgi:RimJ/RimL family protein N-acetyltransferase